VCRYPRRLSVLALVWIVSTAIPDGAAETRKTCLPSDMKQAQREVSHIVDWEELHNSFKRFGQCDSGHLEEEYSYTLGRLLAHNWNHVEALLELTDTDPDFKRFILKHIDENIPEEEAQIITRNARHNCPERGDWLCKAIVDY
jgi:hypothetical protein